MLSSCVLACLRIEYRLHRQSLWVRVEAHLINAALETERMIFVDDCAVDGAYGRMAQHTTPVV